MQAKLLLLGALAVAGAFIALSLNSKPAQTDSSAAFFAFTREHKKVYATSQEAEYRKTVFEQRLARIERHNAQNLSYKLGINKFSDLTFEEFKNYYLSKMVMDNAGNHPAVSEPVTKGKKVDWRDKKVITQVKDQGQCGSCWAFSATGALEAAYGIKNKAAPTELSEQELVDCSGEEGNEGCNGGLMTYAYEYVKKNQLASEEDYAYTAQDGDCSADKSQKRFGLKSYKLLSKFDVNTLITAIDTQPVAVAIEVQDDFMDYSSGIYVNNDASCGDGLNHGVLAVGYDTTSKTPFFIVKNSWSSTWGEEGYIRFAVGTGRGTCGIANKWDAIPQI